MIPLSLSVPLLDIANNSWFFFSHCLRLLLSPMLEATTANSSWLASKIEPIYHPCRGDICCVSSPPGVMRPVLISSQSQPFFHWADLAWAWELGWKGRTAPLLGAHARSAVWVVWGGSVEHGLILGFVLDLKWWAEVSQIRNHTLGQGFSAVALLAFGHKWSFVRWALSCTVGHVAATLASTR